MLVSTGIYEGRRSPVIIQVPKYEEWEQYYKTWNRGNILKSRLFSR